MTGFQPFFNLATGEWIEYTALAEDSAGVYIRCNRRSVPGGVVTEHIYPHQEERFTIEEGEDHFTLNGRALLARRTPPSRTTKDRSVCLPKCSRHR
jgi:hypothetical protein